MMMSLSAALLFFVLAVGWATEQVHFAGEGCVIYDPADPGWSTVPIGDENVVPNVPLGFPFTWAGSIRQAVDIQVNGAVEFQETVRGRTSQIAPYWSDVTTNIAGSIHYKQVSADKFAVVWVEVAAYLGSPNVTNTFSVVLSADNSENPAICFCYCKMEWATDGIGPLQDGGGQASIRMPDGSFYVVADFSSVDDTWNGVGTLDNGVGTLDGRSFCFNSDIMLSPNPADEIISTYHPGGCGDPHFKTWHNEHYQYHGQCDLVLVKDSSFADGLGLDIHIRTKLVRNWSYIKNAVIRLGNDILELQGSGKEDVDKDVHYWINYEYQGDLTEFAGFPVTIKSDGTKLHKNRIEIDLSSKYPSQKIVLLTFKEFVKVDFINPTAKAFGSTVGMLGDYRTGKTLARDGATVLDDFTDLGREWQVLPTDGKLFREPSAPQFPELCLEPEDPRGDRTRRLDESSITEEQAEAACAELKDELNRKDCVYDVLATQDMDMVGAF